MIFLDQALVTSDVVCFRSHIKNAVREHEHGHMIAEIVHLVKAAFTYGGDFVAGFAETGTAGEEWWMTARTTLKAEYAGVLNKLAERFAEIGDAHVANALEDTSKSGEPVSATLRHSLRLWAESDEAIFHTIDSLDENYVKKLSAPPSFGPRVMAQVPGNGYVTVSNGDLHALYWPETNALLDTSRNPLEVLDCQRRR